MGRRTVTGGVVGKDSRGIQYDFRLNGVRYPPTPAFESISFGTPKVNADSAVHLFLKTKSPLTAELTLVVENFQCAFAAPSRATTC